MRRINGSSASSIFPLSAFDIAYRINDDSYQRASFSFRLGQRYFDPFVSVDVLTQANWPPSGQLGCGAPTALALQTFDALGTQLVVGVASEHGTFTVVAK